MTLDFRHEIKRSKTQQSSLAHTKTIVSQNHKFISPQCLGKRVRVAFMFIPDVDEVYDGAQKSYYWTRGVPPSTKLTHMYNKQ